MPRQITHKCNKEAEIAVILEKLKTMECHVSEIHEKIMGNGKPGIIDEMNQFKGGMKATNWIIGVVLTVFGLVLSYVALH